jgi:hypothetical protein
MKWREKSGLGVDRNVIRSLFSRMWRPTAAPQPQTEALSSPPRAQRGSAEKPVVTILEQRLVPVQHQWAKSLVDKFNKEHEGEIMVEYIQGSWDDQATYIQSGAAAGGGSPALWRQVFRRPGLLPERICSEPCPIRPTNGGR